MTLSYSNAPFPVRAEIEAAHQGVWDSIANPGNWWTAAERIEIAREARKARAELGLAEAPSGGSDLPEAAREVAHYVGGAPKGLTRSWFDSLVPDKLTEEEYVEAIGVIVRTVSVDVFCRGAGIPLRAYPDPVPGTPSGERPSTAAVDVGWVPMIPNGPAGGREAVEVFGGVNANVIRALSLVPDEARGIIATGDAQYVLGNNVLDPKFEPDHGISRAQIELVAARISAFHECFY